MGFKFAIDKANTSLFSGSSGKFFTLHFFVIFFQEDQRFIEDYAEFFKSWSREVVLKTVNLSICCQDNENIGYEDYIFDFFVKGKPCHPFFVENHEPHSRVAFENQNIGSIVSIWFSLHQPGVVDEVSLEGKISIEPSFHYKGIVTYILVSSFLGQIRQLNEHHSVLS